MSTHELTQAALIAAQHEDADPDCVIEFSHLPSWNDLNAISGHIHAKGSFTRKWRGMGEAKVIDFAQANDLKLERYVEWFGKEKDQSREHVRLVEPYFLRPVAIDCRVWRPDSRPYDVHNVCLKAVLDGFVDARLLIGDDTRFVKEVSFVYEGVDESLALTRTERATRKAVQDARRLKGQNPKRMPTRARFRIEFFKLS